jgi:hypothetical protein
LFENGVYLIQRRYDMTKQLGSRKYKVGSIIQVMRENGKMAVDFQRERKTGDHWKFLRETYRNPTNSSLERVRQCCARIPRAESHPDFTDGFAWVRTDFHRDENGELR